MFTFSAFVIALGSVFTSVVWACKEGTDEPTQLEGKASSNGGFQPPA
jgi:hypothetical protein